MKESKLIKAVADGDKKAFEHLYEMYSTIIYNTALNYCKNVVEAEEVTQDVFIKIFKSIASFNSKSSLRTWIYRITINAALNKLKKKKNAINKLNKDASFQLIDFNHPGVLLENKENAATLYRVIDCLPDNQKTAFILSYVDSLPRQEVAEIMHTTLKAVESLLQRAKSNLRSELEKYYPHRRKSK